MIPLGKILGEPDVEYHGASAVSHSRLEVFRKRPALYRMQYIDRTHERDETNAFLVGRALHAMALEGLDAFNARFAVKPFGIDRRTTVGKAEWAKFEAANAGKDIINEDDFRLIAQMLRGIQANPAARLLLEGGESEVTWRMQAPGFPLPLQCRTDRFNTNGGPISNGRPYVADIKTVESLDDDAFRNFDKAFVKFGYHRQAGFYLPILQDCGVSCRDFYFIAVEKQAPFGCAVYRPSEDALSAGVDESLDDLRELKECYERNDWPNMPHEVQEIGLPSWYRRKEVAA